MTYLRRLSIGIASAFLIASVSLAPEHAVAQTKLKLVLNWKYQGPQGMFFLAEDNGYFKSENLEVAIDQGDGAATPIPKVASGTYDIGFGDMNALIDFAAKKPEEAPVAVYMMFNRPPFAIAVKSSSSILSAKDLEGKILGGPANDGALKLFPVLCKSAGIDCTRVSLTNFQPNLREQMLMQGQVDGVFGYINTIRFSAKSIGLDPDKQLRFLNYSDYGLDLYSNAIVVSKKLTKENPEAVRGFLRALNRGLQDTIRDPDSAVAAVAKREPLLKAAIERERLDATLRDEMNHPEIARIGLGNVDMARLDRAIQIIVQANSLPRTPKAEELFSSKFLPPREELPSHLF